MHDGSTNRLTLASFDPESRQPAYKACAARVRAGPGRRDLDDRRRHPERIDRQDEDSTMIATESRAEDRGGDRQRHGRPPVLRAAGRPTTSTASIEVVTFCEEPRPAYDRVNLTKYFERRDAEHLKLACPDVVRRERDHAARRRPGDGHRPRAPGGRSRSRAARSSYDAVVLATGSAPFVPTVPGVDKKGVFVYRTIEDLERILAYAGKATSAAVIGGGLLGLEAAKAVLRPRARDPRRRVRPRLMPRQVDDAGSRTLLEKIEGMDVQVHLGKSTREFLGNGKVEGLEFADGSELDVDMVVISAGIRPRDELARDCGLEVGRAAVSSSTTHCERPTRTSSRSARSPGIAA